MIIEAESTTVVSNIPDAKRRKMRISEEGLAHVMSALSVQLYNDPKTAVVREYTANAIDSHIASGQTRPIEISLPDRFTSQFVVEDFGLGMSAEELDENFGDIGASTKRDSNNQIGAFGFGAKSALAVANQFTVRAVKDGKLTIVVIAKSADGINDLSTLVEREVDEPNGVKVSIPIDADEVAEFNDKARRFFRFAEPSLILVDGKPPVSIFEGAVRVSDPANPDFVGYIPSGSDHGETYVVMGGVPYEVTQRDQSESLARTGRKGTYNFFALPKLLPVPIGSVKLTPNREGLRFSDLTKATFDKIFGSFVDGLAATAQQEIDAAEDRPHAYRALKKWTELLGAKPSDFTWKGETVVQKIELAKPVASIRHNAYSDKNDHSTNYSISLDRESKAYIVLGRGVEKYRNIVRYLNDYCEQANIPRDRTFFFAEELSEQMKTPWLTDNPRFEFLDYDEMVAQTKAYRKSLLPPKDPTERKERTKVLYDVLDLENNVMDHVEVKDIPASAWLVNAEDYTDSSPLLRLFFGSRTYSLLTPYPRQKLVERLRTTYPQITHLVFLPRTRKLEVLEKKKAKRTFTSLLSVKDGLIAEIKALSDNDEVSYARWFENWRDEYLVHQLAAHPDTLDEDLKALLPKETAATDGKRLSVLFSVRDDLGFRDMPYMSDNSWKDHSRVKRKEFIEKYPLLEGVHSGFREKEKVDHAVLYVNAVYSTLVQQP